MLLWARYWLAYNIITNKFDGIHVFSHEPFVELFNTGVEFTLVYNFIRFTDTGYRCYDKIVNSSYLLPSMTCHRLLHDLGWWFWNCVWKLQGQAVEQLPNLKSNRVQIWSSDEWSLQEYNTLYQWQADYQSSNKVVSIELTIECHML